MGGVLGDNSRIETFLLFAFVVSFSSKVRFKKKKKDNLFVLWCKSVQIGSAVSRDTLHHQTHSSQVPPPLPPQPFRPPASIYTWASCCWYFLSNLGEDDLFVFRNFFFLNAKKKNFKSR